ncbi:MAG: MltA domain-containing protein [Desulfosalsimonadaceae bacterium]|nr:MltA domain-containing protein [Desulfosalsimonadaceae bacterium]
MTISGNRFFKYVRLIRPAAVLLCAFGMIFMFASGCAALGRMWFAPGKKPVMETVAAKDLPAFADDLNFDDLAAAVSGSIDYYRKLPASKTIDFGKEAYPASHLVQSLEHFLAFIEKKPSPAELSAFIDRDYHVVAFTDRSKPVSVLFTGYYEPFLKGSRVRTETYKYPVYPRPDDLVTFDLSDFSAGCAEKSGVGRLMEGNLVSYYSRSQIEDTDVLERYLSPIAWVDDRVDLFFLQIQGSGKIRLTDGTTLNVHYLISNGHPYKSIGAYLVENKKMKKKDVSMQAIKDYLRAHPEEVQEILHSNPRYVFFETRENGPVGCFNIELTPGRSVALDRQIAPAGALAFIVTEKPVADCSGKIQSWEPFSRFVVNQDTGSAIQGPGRADIFWGNGAYAELAAGYMKQPGNLYFLVLKPDL